MEKLFIIKTLNTPEVSLIPEEGFLKIEGRSIPEDPGEFYEAIIRRLEEYYKNPKEITRVDIKLEYKNSGSSNYLVVLLRIHKTNFDMGNDCLISRYYEEDDESIQELGQHYQSTIKVPMKLVEYY